MNTKIINTYGNYYIKISCAYEPGYYNDSDYVTYIDLMEYGNDEPIETHTTTPINSKNIEFWINELRTTAKLETEKAGANK